nr:FAD-dependent oxidoreductase [Anaerosporomusa subterranea]
MGAVAAGTSAAAKARRNNENAEIKLFEMDSDISYSACGLPYYIGSKVESSDQLVPRNAAFFKSKYNVDIFTGHQVLAINPELKTLEVKKLSSSVALVPVLPGFNQRHGARITHAYGTMYFLYRRGCRRNGKNHYSRIERIRHS